MLKRPSVAVAALFAFVTVADASGTIPGISMSQQFDTLGKPLNGGKLYLIQAGTTSTPQNCYQDSGLTIAWPNPITLDSAGRIPQLFCADGSIKVRLTNAAGVTQLVADGLLVVGPAGGGGGSSVDATTILATGDLKVRYGTGTHSGFVRANGKSIGSAISGATERANLDCQALFEYLWTADSSLAVSGGRGGSANADWVANKNIALPDWRGRAIAALDDMGNSAAGRLTATYFGTAATVLGASGGSESLALTLAQIPSHFHAVYLNDPGHTHQVAAAYGSYTGGTSNGIISAGAGAGFTSGTTISNTTSITVRDTSGGMGTANQTATAGSGTAHKLVQPTMLATVYIKL